MKEYLTDNAIQKYFKRKKREDYTERPCSACGKDLNGHPLLLYPISGESCRDHDTREFVNWWKDPDFSKKRKEGVIQIFDDKKWKTLIFSARVPRAEYGNEPDWNEMIPPTVGSIRHPEDIKDHLSHIFWILKRRLKNYLKI